MEIRDAANAVADALDVGVFVYNSTIDFEGLGLLAQAMKEGPPRKSGALLLLTTLGGEPDAAYQIARVLQKICGGFHLCIPSICKSAGTLIALGAREISMMVMAEIGPLDVQLVQRDEIGQVRSGLVVRTALEGLAEETMNVYEQVMLGIKNRSGQAVSFEVASHIAAKIATGVMAPIYSQINPEALGNDLRDLNIAKAYGERLGKYGRNVKPQTVRRLVEGYPAHRFVIDSSEAEELFHKVTEPTSEIHVLIEALGARVYQPEAGIVARLDGEDDEEGGAHGGPSEGDSSGVDELSQELGQSNRRTGEEPEAREESEDAQPE